MASKRAVATALKMLGRAFAGVVDEPRIEVYAAALEDLTDEELATAATLVIRNYTGEFIPPPAVIRKAIAPAPVAVDAPSIIRRIEKLMTYNPNMGMLPPPTETVRTQLGEQAAYAYAAAGGPRLFSDNETTREIAARDFQRAMAEAVGRPQAPLPVLGAGELAANDAGVKSIIDNTADRLSMRRQIRARSETPDAAD